jgi:hypothetical protein
VAYRVGEKARHQGEPDTARGQHERAAGFHRARLGTPYSARQMGYDLRRLARKGLIARLHRRHRSNVSPAAMTVAFPAHRPWIPRPGATPRSKPGCHAQTEGL